MTQLIGTNCMKRLLIHVGVDTKIIEIIKKLYKDNKVKFLTGNVNAG